MIKAMTQKMNTLGAAFKRFCANVCNVKKNAYICIWRTDAKASIQTYLFALHKALPFVHYRYALVSVLQNFDRATPFFVAPNH